MATHRAVRVWLVIFISILIVMLACALLVVRAVPPQESLYFGRCNVNDLHRAVAASSGDGVTTWAETDALDSATEVQGSLYLAR